MHNISVHHSSCLALYAMGLPELKFMLLNHRVAYQPSKWKFVGLWNVEIQFSVPVYVLLCHPLACISNTITCPLAVMEVAQFGTLSTFCPMLEMMSSMWHFGPLTVLFHPDHVVKGVWKSPLMCCIIIIIIFSTVVVHLVLLFDTHAWCSILFSPA